MIALLTGNIAYKSIDHIIVDVGGVGYRLMIPLSTFYSLPEEGTATFHVYTHVKEDAIHLYGFLTPEEKEMFGLLISVSGVGPKLAVNILSNIPPGELCEALSSGNVKRLTAIPGIGTKSAERLVLELKEKVGKLNLATEGTPPPAPKDGPENILDDTLSALMNLGYKENQAKKVLDTLEVAPEATVETTLKAALKVLLK